MIIKIYVSHSIRGKYGKDATYTQMQENCDAIIALVKDLRLAFPTVEFYVPAESEPFVGRAHRKHYMTEEQILDVDCDIISDGDAVIVYVPEDDELQGGRKIEYDHAVANGISVLVFGTPLEAVNWIAGQMIRR